MPSSAGVLKDVIILWTMDTTVIRNRRDMEIRHLGLQVHRWVTCNCRKNNNETDVDKRHFEKGTWEDQRAKTETESL
jgi:hypothetical protein